MRISTKQLTTWSIFAALTAISSQISIPLPFTPVPVNLSALSILLAGAMLSARGALISQLVYVILGLIGLPVFANFSAGVGVLFGPTGGYIIGYILAAPIVALILRKDSKPLFIYAFAMTIGIIVCYLAGTIWFMYITKSNLSVSLTMCVLPFIPGDILKIIITSCIAKKLNNLKLRI